MEYRMLLISNIPFIVVGQEDVALQKTKFFIFNLTDTY